MSHYLRERCLAAGYCFTVSFFWVRLIFLLYDIGPLSAAGRHIHFLHIKKKHVDAGFEPHRH